MKKRTISFLLTLCLAAALCLTAALMPVGAAAEDGPFVSQNMYDQNYTVWADTVRSYLYENERGGLTRVEYTYQKQTGIVVEEYDSSFQFLSKRTIPFELDFWGGFFAGKDYNFLIFGRSTSQSETESEAIRVVKYSKDWQRLGQASIFGDKDIADIVTPFYAGSLRCAEYDGKLFIHTSRKMYGGHQANISVVVRENDMTASHSEAGYVSHSFNQFILINQKQTIVTLDHGDGYPRRGALLREYNKKADQVGFNSSYFEVAIQDFPGELTANPTGASLGGLAETADGYVVAYNYDGKGSGTTTADRSVYFAYVDKASLHMKTRVISDAGTLTPVLAPTGLDGGYILWNASDSKGNGTNTLYYARYSADGTVGPVQTATARLSDCQPVVYNGKVVWYTTGTEGRKASIKTAPTFYQLDENGVTTIKTAPDLTGTCGDDLTWTIYNLDTGLLEIEGTGPMGSYSNSTLTGARNPWFDFCYDIKTVTIGSGVTSIGDYAFYDCDALTGVTIGSGVTGIGAGAFRACVSLPGVTLPGGVTSIGDNAFQGCTSLTSVNIPNKVTRIGDGAFNSCASLTGVTIPNSVTSIGNEAFRACRSLTGLTIPDSVTSIGENAFYYCDSLKSVTLGKGVTKLGHYAFRHCDNLTGVTVHSDITDTGYGIFEGCGKLTVTFGDGVTTIKQGLFTGDSSALTGVTIGGNVTSIEGEAFKDCKNLTNVTIGSGVSSIGQNAFRNTPWLKNQGELPVVNGILFAYQGDGGEVVIPGGVTQIGTYAFYNCGALTRVTIPVSVVKVGDHAFWGCSGLSRVHYEGSSTQWKAITIENGNDRLINANRSYGSTGTTGTALTASMFTVNTASETYDGKAKTKTVTGKYAGAALTEGTDYVVTYADNTNAGTATITITGQGSYAGTLTYQFTINQAERTLTAVMNPTQLRAGGSAGIITLTDNAAGDHPSYTYTSGKTSIATVSDGTVTGVGRGVTTITINAPATANYKAGSAKINVTVTNMPVQELWFVYDVVEKTCGDPAFTNAVNNLSTGGGAVTYTSSDPSVATVDAASGKVTILSAGTATITATAAEVTDVWAESSVSYTLVVSPDTASNPGEPKKPTFNDVPEGVWYSDPVAWAVEGGITNGYGDYFGPDDLCTNVQILTFLYRAVQGNGVANAADMDKAVSWARGEGMIGDNFVRDAYCTRSSAVMFIWQALGSMPPTKGNSFTDVPANAPYADAVSWAVENGVTNGYTSEIFGSDDTCSRGHIVTFLYRACVEPNSK